MAKNTAAMSRDREGKGNKGYLPTLHLGIDSLRGEVRINLLHVTRNY